MAKVLYNREKTNDILSSNLDSLLKNLDNIKNEISKVNFPTDFPYSDYLISINDLIDNYKYLFNNFSDNLKSLDVELVSFEDSMMQEISKIDNIEYNK